MLRLSTLFATRYKPLTPLRVQARHNLHTSSRLDPRLLQEIKASSHQLIKNTVNEQTKRGYNADNWGLTTVDQLPRLLVQSVANGETSICRPASFDFETLSNYPLPAGSSPYFATACAYAPHQRIHANSPLPQGGNSNIHYASSTQTRKHPKHGYREIIAVFSLCKVARIFPEIYELPVATSPIEANPQFGDSSSLQIVVPTLLLPILHMGCLRIISHKDDYGVMKVNNIVDLKTNKIRWFFTEHPSKNIINSDSKAAKKDILHLPSGKY